MAKFKMSLKLTGLEISIEGERSDAAVMSSSIGQQFAHLLAPTAGIIQATDARPASQVAYVKPDEELPALESRPKSKPRKNRANGGGSKSNHHEFTHDPVSYGFPLQAWNPTQKTLWLLSAIQPASGDKIELSSSEISLTFGKYFSEYGKILAGNITRDLSKKKSGPEAWFSETTTNGSSKWSLTSSGKKEAQKLITLAKEHSTHGQQ